MALRLGCSVQHTGPPTYNEDDEHDYDYVLDLQLSCDTSIGAILSTRALQFRDKSTLQLEQEIPHAHDDAIHELWMSPTESWKSMTCSSDGSVKIWDRRARGGGPQQTFRAQARSGVYSADIGLGGTTVATGSSDSIISFFDLRRSTAVLGTYEDAHCEPVTQVRFHPLCDSRLVSGSEDGVLCVFDCTIADADDAMLSIVNAESAIRKLAFWGPEEVAICTHSETLDVWNLESARRVGHFRELRSYCAQELRRPVDYLVDGVYDPVSKSKWVVAGDQTGKIELLEWQECGNPSRDPVTQLVAPLQTLRKGHQAGVRCAAWAPDHQVLYTGGEDARISVWSDMKQHLQSSTATTLEKRAARKWHPY